jgi:hypothetical protein
LINLQGAGTMSVGDVNSVDPTMGIDPTGGVYPSTVPEHVTLFRRAIESAQNNMTAGHATLSTT